MQSINDLIRARRTTVPEDMNGKTVDDAIIRELLESANWAPTHGLTEPWRFTVFSGHGLRIFSEFHAGLYKRETPPAQFLEKKYDKLLHRADQASHIITIGVHFDDKGKIPNIEEICATAAAVQNMLLVAAQYGLAVYWGSGGMCYHPDMARFLEVHQVLGYLFIGHTDQPMPEGKRLSGIDEKVRIVR